MLLKLSSNFKIISELFFFLLVAAYDFFSLSGSAAQRVLWPPRPRDFRDHTTRRHSR
jgi:hypothetical protein